MDKKAPMVSPLAKIERRFIDAHVDKFPQWVKSWHLTMLTVVWSVGVILSGWGAQCCLSWLWLSSLMIFLQWFTDSFDGSLGRTRQEGLVRWGYYMDHFLDYIFISALIISYTFLLEGAAHYLAIILVPLVGSFWVSSFLLYGITGELKITYLFLGPTEVRLFFILLNTLIFFLGTELFQTAVPYLFCILLFLLIVVIYQTHKTVWKLDMEAKK